MQPAHSKLGEEGSPAQPRGTRSPRAAIPRSLTLSRCSAGCGNTSPTRSRASATPAPAQWLSAGSTNPCPEGRSPPPVHQPTGRTGNGLSSRQPRAGGTGQQEQDSRGTARAHGSLPGRCTRPCSLLRACPWSGLRGGQGAGGRDSAVCERSHAVPAGAIQGSHSSQLTPRHGACDVGPRSLAPTGSRLLLLPARAAPHPQGPRGHGGAHPRGALCPWSSPGCPTARSTWGCAGVRSFRARLAPPAPSPLQGHEQSPDCSASRSGLCPLTGLD